MRRNLTFLLTLVVFWAGTLGSIGQTVDAASPSSSALTSAENSMPSTKPAVRVMLIGGSVAHGWNDPEHNGYLHRTFQTLTEEYGVTYAVYDKTIVGANAVQLQETLYKGDYEKWLVWIRPQVVVISWGLLNDCLPKTPMAEFDGDLNTEIQEALTENATVFVVTPPVTKASFTQYLVQEQAYVNAEVALVKQLHNPRVQLVDIYDQMKQFVDKNHLDVATLSADGWHPNSAGHQLAARMFVADIDNAFKLSAPAAPNPPAPAWSRYW